MTSIRDYVSGLARRLLQDRPRTAEELLRRIRTEREQRECALEQGGIKYLLQRWRRYWKDVTGARQGAHSFERVREHSEYGALHDPERQRIVMGEMKEIAAGEFKPAAVGAMNLVLAEEMADRLEAKVEAEKLTLAKLDQWLEKRRTKEDVPAPTPQRIVSPLARGSMLPTLAEYLGTAIPPYVSTEEEAVRELELRTTIAAWQRATEERAERAGPGKCQGVPMDARGHVWWKVPCQPVFECIECGLEAPSLRWSLNEGKLKPLGLTHSREFLKMGEAINAERFEFLLPTGVRPESPKELVAYEARNRLMPLIPTGLEEVKVLGPGQRTTWHGKYGDPCEACGSIFELHRPDPDIAGRMYCPQEGVDVT